MAKKSDVKVGALVQVLRRVKVGEDRSIDKGWILRVMAVTSRGIEVGDPEDRYSVAKHVAAKHLKVLPQRSVMVRAWNDDDDETDYGVMESGITRLLLHNRGIEVTFQKPCRPEDALQKSTDVYMIDYGGMGVYGALDCAVSALRQVIHLAEERPNMLIILWTAFTGRFYLDAMESEAVDVVRPNVVFKDGDLQFGGRERDDFPKAFEVWFGPPLDGKDN